MRIAELSRQTGVPVATIKFYLREGILPPGELTSPNQATYAEQHVRRLRLVRALVETGRLSIVTIRELLADLDRPEPNLHHILGRALHASVGARQPGGGPGVTEAEQETAELIARHGWQVCGESPARQSVTETIAAMRHLGAGDLLALIDEYAAAAERIAVADLEQVRRRAEPDAIVYGAVVGTILGDRLIAGLRRLAQEHVSARVLGSGGAQQA